MKNTTQPERRWHALSEEKILEIVCSDRQGLSGEEAERRLTVFGPNELPATAGRSALQRFLAQFNNVLIYFLLVAAAAAALLNHIIDASVIVAVVVVNAIVGYLQEGKAERALNAIRSMITSDAMVLRNGQRVRVPVRELVQGDIVTLEAGDKVPADLRLLRARRLLIDEALLTGESLAAEKHDGQAPAEAGLGDRQNMAFSGTLVVAGQASGVVVETGIHTQIGQISRLLQSVEVLATPLLRQIDNFARRFTWVVLIGGAALFSFAVLVRQFDWIDALIAVVALAVGIVPEGLPAVITITLAIGVRQMAARNAVIRKLPAVETLGATSVICTDKTGTLTRNEMTARHIDVLDYQLLVSGSGYEPVGEIRSSIGADDATALAAAEDLLRCSILCNCPPSAPMAQI